MKMYRVTWNMPHINPCDVPNVVQYKEREKFFTTEKGAVSFKDSLYAAKQLIKLEIGCTPRITEVDVDD